MNTDNYSIHTILDGDEEFTMIEITQAQYDQYVKEAQQIEMNINDYIELAMKHEFLIEQGF